MSAADLAMEPALEGPKWLTLVAVGLTGTALQVLLLCCLLRSGGGSKEETPKPKPSRPASDTNQVGGGMPILKQRRLNCFLLGELRLDWSRPLESLEPELPSNYAGSMCGSTTVLELVRQMACLHYRSVVVRKAEEHAFFDVMDLNRLLLQKLDETCGTVSVQKLQEVLDFVAGAPCSLVANSSSRSAFVPVPVTAALREVCSTMMRDDVKRVPLVDGPGGDVRRVFNAADTLSLALRIPEWAAVLGERKANIFENPDRIQSVCVASDETVLSALRKMDASKLTLCPVIDHELSCPLEGAVAIGVVSATDLKHVLLCGDAAPLAMNVLDFLAWRKQGARGSPDQSTGRARGARFPYVSIDRNSSLRSLSRKLLKTNLQRIFLSNSELSHIVGVVSARDILKVVWPELSQTEPGSFTASPSAPAETDDPFDKVTFNRLSSVADRRVSWADDSGVALSSIRAFEADEDM